MRQSRSTVFANWSNDPGVDIGAIGYVDPITGEFTRVGKIAEGSGYFIDSERSETWEVAASDTHRSSGEVNLDAAYTDPETGIKVTGAVKSEWKFSNSDSVAAKYVVAKESKTKNVGVMARENWQTIATAAYNNNYLGDNDNIYQGFGVITDVIWAKRGVAIGGVKEGSSFSMTATAGFFSPKNDSVKITPKFFSKSTSDSVVSHVFPLDEGSASAETMVPVAYVFTSFEGKKPIPGWTKPINQLELHIYSKPGSTYITKWDVSYDTDNEKGKTNSGSFPAPQNGTVYLPKDASNVELHVKLPGIFSHNYCTFNWHDPINQWADGRKELSTYGVWPGEGRCKDED